jgi:hypothetical protein
VRLGEPLAEEGRLARGLDADEEDELHGSANKCSPAAWGSRAGAKFAHSSFT